MERLTEIKTHVTGFSYADKKEGIFAQNVYAKLAEYEDTGLTPEQIKALTADKDEQAGTIMRLANGLKKLRSSLQWLKETIHDLDYKAWAEDNIGKIDALLGGKEDA